MKEKRYGEPLEKCANSPQNLGKFCSDSASETLSHSLWESKPAPGACNGFCKWTNGDLANMGFEYCTLAMYGAGERTCCSIVFWLKLKWIIYIIIGRKLTCPETRIVCDCTSPSALYWVEGYPPVGRAFIGPYLCGYDGKVLNVVALQCLSFDPRKVLEFSTAVSIFAESNYLEWKWSPQIDLFIFHYIKVLDSGSLHSHTVVHLCWERTPAADVLLIRPFYA